jgi:hypothetical protein
MSSFLGRLVLPLAGLLALGVAWTEYSTLRALNLAQPGSALQELSSRQPWSGFAGGALADSLQHTWRLDPAGAEAVFAWQLERQPLDAYRWLDRASIAQSRRAGAQQVQHHVEAAVAVQPHSRDINWRAAIMSIQLGQVEAAERHLRRWLQGQPRQTARALFLTGRWIEDPDDLLDRTLPEGAEYLAAALDFARRAGRMDLAEVAWSRLSHQGATDGALFDFVELALAEGDHPLAISVWQSRFPDFAAGQVPNGDFRHELGAGRGLDWDARMPAGAKASRDQEQFVTEPASLRIDFDGNENLQLRRPSVRMPVDPDTARWEISGHWRAYRLTTRGLPYLTAWAEGGRGVRADVPGASFDWTPFRIEVENPDGATMLHLELRRDRPGVDFDRFLSGSLWLDALRLTPLPPIPEIVPEATLPIAPHPHESTETTHHPGTRARPPMARHPGTRRRPEEGRHLGKPANPQKPRHPGNREAVIRDPAAAPWPAHAPVPTSAPMDPGSPLRSARDDGSERRSASHADVIVSTNGT